MNRLILSITLLSGITNAEVTPMYDRESAAKTKNIYLMSQLLPEGDDFPIKVESNVYLGGRNFLSRFSENDPDWQGSVLVDTKEIICLKQDAMVTLIKQGNSLKSVNGDVLVVTVRELVAQVKQMGAKYIYFGRKYFGIKDANGVYITDPEFLSRKNIIRTNVSFGDYFKTLISGEDESAMSIYKERPARCDADTSFTLGQALWIAGQIASVAVGTSGARVGDAGMAELGGNIGKTADTTVKASNSVSATQVGTYPLVTRMRMEAYGLMKPETMYRQEWSGYRKFDGYVFPVDEVEKVLSQYMDIPYSASIKKH